MHMRSGLSLAMVASSCSLRRTAYALHSSVVCVGLSPCTLQYFLVGVPGCGVGLVVVSMPIGRAWRFSILTRWEMS